MRESFKCWNEAYQAFEKPLPGGLLTTGYPNKNAGNSKGMQAN